ncbi:hypothetical protein M2165_003082 [Variovorax sp. TBS-050B]|uniref:hypothetical protein n=1 Tax=Variovorax sp. TBS-050B TaxID=2940551 RepID=UPI002474AC6F|nr:hypothetical protein [Variovorax sp. TBS-050B]MDH6593193.1 hypothetical protein [Variovorax sp. TBS-050B]
MLGQANERGNKPHWRVRAADRLTVKSKEHIARGRLSSAANALHLAAFLHPTSQRWLHLAEMYCDQGLAVKGDIPITMALSTPDGKVSIEVLICKGVVECAKGQLHWAEEWLRLADFCQSNNPWVAYALGSVLLAQGKVEEADALFKRDVPVATGMGQPTYTRVLLSDCAGGVAPVRKISALPEIVGPEHGPTFFAAADSVYFCRYAREVVGSVARSTERRGALHLHVINPDEAASALAEELRRKPGVTISTEHVDLECLQIIERKTYYSCARYLLLPELLDRAAGPVVVVDMDQLVMRDPAPLLALARQGDVAVLRFPGSEFNALSTISATLLVVAPTEGGRAFAGRLQEHITRAIPARMLWHLDQAALAKAFFSMPQLRRVAIPTSMLHLTGGTPAKDALFWSVTNSIESNLGKLEMDSYRRFGQEPPSDLVSPS